MEKIKKYYNSIYFKIFIAMIGIVIPILVEKFHYTQDAFSFDRFFLEFIVLEFILMGFIFDFKKYWNLMFKYRYVVGIVFFAFLVVNGYHGSSIGKYNDHIEGSNYISEGSPIIGRIRDIRVDEYGVSTQMMLSQAAEANRFSDYNNLMMGKKTNVSFYPKLVSYNINVLSTLNDIGFLFLPLEQAFSFHWYFQYFALFFASLEFFMLITKKNKVWSLVGAFLILFAPAVQWWESTSLIYSGMLAIVFFDKFLNSDKKKFKLLYSVLIGICGSIYFMNMYPAWMIPYAYFFFGMVIYEIINNKGKYKILDIILMALIVIGVMVAIILPSYLSSREIFTLVSKTVYPGARFSQGGSNWQDLFNYLLSPFLPFRIFANPSEYSQFLSFYPIPFILGLWYLVKNIKSKKNDVLLNIMLIVIVLLSVWNFIKLPYVVSKVSLLYMSTPNRTAVTVGFICSVLMVYCLANYSSKTVDQKYFKIITAIACTIFGVYVVSDLIPDFTKKMQLFALILFSIIGIMVLFNNKKANNVLAIIIVFVSVISGLFVHPFSKGLGVIYNKKISTEIQDIVKSDSNALWAAVDTSYIVNNYALANGARMLNSTNYYPNLDLWNVIDDDNSYEQIWNRYAHISISITDEDSYPELTFADSITLHLNTEDICKLDIKYLLSSNKKLESYSSKKVDITNIYNYDNMNVYNVVCK